MKFNEPKGPGSSYHCILTKLEEYIGETLRVKDRAIISVVGKNGTGKSYFGRYIRKNGIGRFDKKTITVIDDRIVFLDSLGFFKRRFKIPRNGVDELEPYLSRLPGRKKIIIYINNTPSDKITRADILLILTIDENLRRKRLEHRYMNDPVKLSGYLRAGSKVEDYKIKYSYLIESDVSE